jgi:hypothetical protein
LEKVYRREHKVKKYSKRKNKNKNNMEKEKIT